MIRTGSLEQMLDIPDDVHVNALTGRRRNDGTSRAFEEVSIVRGEESRKNRDGCEGLEEAAPAQCPLEAVDFEENVVD